jgi:site-specific DNA-methyltransferase (adenine-specific)
MIIHGDCLEEIRKLGDNSVDLVITSPPYKDKDGYKFTTISATFFQCYRVLKENSLFFLNFGHLAEDKMRPFNTCQYALNRGFKLNDTITWVKNHYKPIQGKRRVNNLTEFIFILYKGKMPKIDRLVVGIPYADKSNARRYNKGQDLHCAGNVWYINYPTINNSDEKPHPDMFPLELPEKCIKLSGLKSGIVLDPYMGSGTTCLAAKKCGLDYIGIEKQKSNYDVAFERINSN